MSAYDYWVEFSEFFWAMCKTMKANHLIKGSSWKSTCTEAYLRDKMIIQLEDMQNRDDEDFYANIANYCAMLWLRELRGFDTSAKVEE